MSNQLPQDQRVRYCGASIPGATKDPLDFTPCAHLATWRVLVHATGGYVYRCGIHAKRYKTSSDYEVESLR